MIPRHFLSKSKATILEALRFGCWKLGPATASLGWQMLIPARSTNRSAFHVVRSFRCYSDDGNLRIMQGLLLVGQLQGRDLGLLEIHVV